MGNIALIDESLLKMTAKVREEFSPSNEFQKQARFPDAV